MHILISFKHDCHSLCQINQSGCSDASWFKSYWSYNLTGDTFGIMKSRTTSLSTSLDNIGDTEIDLRSEGIETGLVLETDVTAAIFQADGTLPIERE